MACWPTTFAILAAGLALFQAAPASPADAAGPSFKGKKAKRSKLKKGMKCTFTTRGSAAKAIAC